MEKREKLGGGIEGWGVGGKRGRKGEKRTERVWIAGGGKGGKRGKEWGLGEKEEV